MGQTSWNELVISAKTDAEVQLMATDDIIARLVSNDASR